MLRCIQAGAILFHLRRRSSQREASLLMMSVCVCVFVLPLVVAGPHTGMRGCPTREDGFCASYAAHSNPCCGSEEYKERKMGTNLNVTVQE